MHDNTSPMKPIYFQKGLSCKHYSPQLGDWFHACVIHLVKTPIVVNDEGPLTFDLI